MGRRLKEKVDPFDWAPFSEAQINSILKSKARINIWEGSVRSGKTIASIVRWLEYIKSGPKGELLMIGKTERTLKRNILDPILSIVGTSNYRYIQGAGELYLFGRKIYVVGANDERSENKIRGMTLAGAYGDELTLWPKGFFQMLLTRLSVKGSKFFGTTNPDSPGHWLLKEYLEKEETLNLKRFKFTLDDNLSLDEEYVESLKEEFSGVFYDRFIKGEWALAEGMIYRDFDKSRHYISSDDFNKIRIKKYFAGVDWGYEHYGAITLLAEDFAGNTYLVEEHAAKLEEIDYWVNIAKDIKRRFGSIPFYCDTARPEHIQRFRREKIKALNADKSVMAGIEEMSTMIKQDTFYVVEEAVERFNEEIYSYVWNTKTGDPVKEYDDVLDSIRYAVYTHYKKYILSGRRRKSKGGAAA